MADFVAFLVFALACAVPSAFVGYRHGSWKGRQAGRRDILERLPSADALAILQGVDTSAVVVDPLAGRGGVSSPALIGGACGRMHAPLAAAAAPMLTDPSGGTGARPLPAPLAGPGGGRPGIVGVSQGPVDPARPTR